MSSSSSLPSSSEILDAFARNNVSIGRQLLVKLLQQGTASSKNIPAVVSSLKDILFQSDSGKVETEEHVVDSVWLVSCSLLEEKEEGPKENGDKSKEEEKSHTNNGNANNVREALIQILQSLLEADGDQKEEEELWLSKKHSFALQLQSQLDPPLLEQAKLIASEKDLMKKLRMLNTKNYRQHKFNLLQEESEGYAKVLESLVKQDHSRLKAITGTFHVDPNRVLDLALDVLIHKDSASTANIDWLKEYSVDKIPALLSFKLRNAESSWDVQKILQAIATLAIHKPDILPLTKMELYLEPVTTKLEQTFPLYQRIERKRVQSVGRVHLGGSSTAHSKEAERDAKDQAKLMELMKELQESQRLQLLGILLKEGQWDLAIILFPDLTELQKVLTLFQYLGAAVCDMIQGNIAPLCAKYCPVPEIISDVVEKGDGDTSETTNVTTADQFVETVSMPLHYIVESGCIVTRPSLFCQLCRVLHALLMKEYEPREGTLSPKPALYSFIESFLLPSLSLFPANPALSMEIWSILRLFPYTSRYQLYRDWRGVGLEKAGLQLFGGNKKPLVMIESEMHAGKDARYVLKRLSKETIRESCRQVAKVTYCNPLVMFTNVLGQIESYDNLVSVMVDALRFVSPLGLDVLSFCMLSRLCGSSTTDGGRSRSKESGINVALWLQSMESFIGTFYQRCPFVEFRGIICYVMRRLRCGHVTELGVLKSLLKITGGWSFADYSPTASLSTTQLEGGAGTTLLRRQTMAFNVVEGFDLRSSCHLRSVLQNDDLGVSLLILLAQVRSRIVFDSKRGDKKPVKLIGSLFDTTQLVMSMLLDFLTKSSEEVAQTNAANHKKSGQKTSSGQEKHSEELLKYASSLPKLPELVEIYGIDMATAWMLCRPLVRTANEIENRNGDNDPVKAFQISDAAREGYKRLVSSETIWSDISPAFFEMFYTHTIYDLFCPENIYISAISHLNREVESLNQRQTQGAPPPGAVGPQTNTDDKIERLKRVASVLSSQLPQQQQHVETIQNLFQPTEEGTKLYFPKNEVSISAVNTFLSQCIFPRCMQGPYDALYCAHFVWHLHAAGTPGFSTLQYLDELFAVLSSSLFGVTEGEAANLSILLLETWKFVNRWRYDDGAYEKEVAGKPGSYMVDPVEEGAEAGESTTREGNLYSVSFEQYKALFVKWHISIGAAALGCLKSSEYIHTRASLIVLSRIVDVFPSRPNLGNKLFEVLEPMTSEKNPLQDIRSAAQSYIMQLKRAQADGVWKEEDAAVVQARIRAEKEAQVLRKKKAEEMFDEIKIESEKITAEIGSDEPRGRGDRFGGRDRRGRPGDEREFSRGGPGHDDRRSPLLDASVPSFEPTRRLPGGDLPRGADRGDRKGGISGRDEVRARDDRRIDSETRGGRDAGPLLGSLGRLETHVQPPRGRIEPPRGGAGPGEDKPRGLEGRWEGSRPVGRGRPKRQRSHSPGADRDGRGGSDGGDRDEHPASKRQRTDHISKRSPPHSGSGAGGRRPRR